MGPWLRTVNQPDVLAMDGEKQRRDAKSPGGY
jgi:hypothetical protein